MNHKSDHLFTVSHCPSEEVLLDYVKKRLSAQQSRMVEIHIADCPMCSDYVDGLSLMSDADNIHAITQQLNIEIDKASGRKTKKFFFRYRYMSAAAAVLLILVSVTFLLQNQIKMTMNEDMVAQNDMESKNKDDASPMEESSELETETRLYESAKKAAPPISVSLDDDVKQERVVAQTNSGQSSIRGELQADIVVADEVMDDDYRTDQYSLVLEEVAEVQNTASKTTGGNDVDRSKDASSPASLKQVESENAKDEDSNYWRKATTGGVKRKAEASESSMPYSQHQQGIDLFEGAKYQASFQYFEKVLKANPKDQTAKWYCALNLIKLKRTDEAKVLLQSIIDEGGTYKAQAKDELKKLTN
jgi:hypothetical protein